MLRRNTCRLTSRFAPLFFLLLAVGALAEENIEPKAEIIKLQSWSELTQNGEKQLVVLLVEQTDCRYCKTVKNDFLNPFVLSQKYHPKVVFSSVLIDGGEVIHDQSGKSVPVKKFAYRYGARFVPTVLFLDSQANQIHEPLIGLGNQDYYGYYLEQAIKQSLSE